MGRENGRKVVLSEVPERDEVNFASEITVRVCRIIPTGVKNKKYGLDVGETYYGYTCGHPCADVNPEGVYKLQLHA